MATKEPYEYMTTLRDILEKHPEWADIPVGIYMPDGRYDYVGGCGTVYVAQPTEDEIVDFEDDDYVGPTLVFAGN